MLLELILVSIYFVLPAYVANMSPLFAQALRLPFGIPISEKHLGAHKTYRGYYSGYLGALGTLYLQQYFLAEGFGVAAFGFLDYSEMNLFFFAFLFGFGALFGDSVESFFKRRRGIRPGASWPVFDQLDLIAGALIFTYPFADIPVEVIIVLLGVSPLLHVLANVIGYAIGIKKVRW